MRYGTSYETFHCTNPLCDGFVDGFDIRWYPATMTDPGEYASDSCPHCGSSVVRQAIDPSDALAGFIDDMNCAYLDADAPFLFTYVNPLQFDAVSVLRVVHQELERQRKNIRDNFPLEERRAA